MLSYFINVKLLNMNNEIVKNFPNRKTFKSYLSPQETAIILRDFLWTEHELSRMCFGWTPALEEFEAKYNAGQFGYWHNLNVQKIEKRLRELPGGVGPLKSAEFLRFGVDRLSLAPDESCFWCSYELILSSLLESYEILRSQMDEVTNAPTVDLLEEIIFQGQRTRKRLAPFLSIEVSKEWHNYAVSIMSILESDGEGEWPDLPTSEPVGPVPSIGKTDPEMSNTKAQLIAKQNLSKEAASTYNLYADPMASPLIGTPAQMVFINASEVIAAERVAYMYYMITGLSLDFYHDLSRHMWDEFRHSKMGIRRIRELGYQLNQFTFFGESAVSPQTTLQEHYEFYESLTMHAEACSFTFKSASAELLRKSGDIRSAIQSEFDVADEKLHVGFGTKWSPVINQVASGETLTHAALVKRFRLGSLKKQGFTDQEAEELQKNQKSFCNTTAKVRAVILGEEVYQKML